MRQLDLFDLVDANNVVFRIYYMDKGELKCTEQLSATKENIFKAIGEWCAEHKNYRFLYYKSNKDLF